MSVSLDKIDNVYAPPASNLSPELLASDGAPVLWNPTATTIWGFFLTPVFGAYLQMRNWETLGKPDEARTSKYWSIGSAAGIVATVAVTIIAPDSILDRISNFSHLINFIAWYAMSARDQGQFVTYSLDGNYIKRGWLKVLLVGIGVYLAMVALIMLVFIGAYAAGLLPEDFGD